MNYLVGIGNYSMTDDGVGLHLIEYISDHNLAQGYEALDLSANALNLLSYFTESTAKIVIVDCLKLGLQPGDLLVFTPEEVETKKELAGISTHEGDILKVIQMGKDLGYPVPPIQLMGIQPERVGHGFDLTRALKERLPEYARVAAGLVM